MHRLARNRFFVHASAFSFDLTFSPHRSFATSLIRNLAISLFLFPFLSHAVVFYSTGDPNHNTTPPQGDLADSGWQYLGSWGFSIGTPISSNLFITAKHVGGPTNHLLTLNGASYVAIASYPHPRADFSVWKVSTAFTNFAPIYSSTNEVGRPLVVFGRGRQRGEELRIAGALRGWAWGNFDGRLRWGENHVFAITDSRGEFLFTSNHFECLAATFDQNGGTNEAHLSNGDSGGAVFIQENGTWKLAGISFAVSGRYNTNTSGKGFDATLFDERGFYEGSENNWEYQYGQAPRPGAFYAVRLSKYLPWIERVIQHGNPYGPIILETTTSLDAPFTTAEAAEINPDSKTVQLSPSPAAAFFRLRAIVPLRITSITNSATSITLHFEE